jgi:hypothetical protein
VEELPVRHKLLGLHLICFFEQPENLSRLFGILYHKNKPALRVIDWFVTMYAAKNNVVYQLGNGSLFIVNANYRSQLKSFSKRFFDAFCRNERFTLSFEGREIQTNIGQLNFLKWALENQVVDYVISHYKEICDHLRRYEGKSETDATTNSDNQASTLATNHVSNTKQESNIVVFD